MQPLDGQIIRLPDGKRFGFIRDLGPQAPRADYFFHADDVRNATFDELQIQDRVTFRPQESPRGLRATDVTYVGR